MSMMDCINIFITEAPRVPEADLGSYCSKYHTYLKQQILHITNLPHLQFWFSDVIFTL